MIELCRLPDVLVVADHTIGGELIGGMIRGSSCVKIALVAAKTFPGQSAELVIYVAIITGYSSVGAAKFKAAGLHVVERPAFPLFIAMANGAIL